MMNNETAVDKITRMLDLGRKEQEIVAEVLGDVIRLERENAKEHLHFAADERDRTILLSGLLERAREYVTDALEAMEHSDGRDLLRDIDAALQAREEAIPVAQGVEAWPDTRTVCEQCGKAGLFFCDHVAAPLAREDVGEALRLAESLCAQVKTDLAAAHEQICKLQGLDPETHSWPEWSSPANTLRWIDETILPAIKQYSAHPTPAEPGDTPVAVAEAYRCGRLAGIEESAKVAAAAIRKLGEGS